MKLRALPKFVLKRKKRVGRGIGSGKGGHTSSRGQKGQKSRSSVALWFEGGQLPFIRRFPFQRGKGRFKSLKVEVLIVNVGELEKLPAKVKEVTIGSLVEGGLVSSLEASKKTVKLLSGGKLSRPFSVKVAATKRAIEKIKDAGGTVS